MWYKNEKILCVVIAVKKVKRLKYACYTVNVAMAVIGCLSPLLFLTFRAQYGLSYSLLGLLVVANFVTQLTVDLILSFFSHKFNIPRLVKTIPVLTAVGFAVYALWPTLWPESAYAGLLLGTVLFSASGGLAEVLISPVIAALPAKDPDREMSKLHAVYAWGVVGVVLFSTLFLRLLGNDNWPYLGLVFLLIPLLAAALFAGVDIPTMKTPQRVSGALAYLKDKRLWLCVAGIFLGAAAEGTMGQWASGYLEQALGIPKVWGDIGGVALFGVMLGLGRSMYAKRGKYIGRVLFISALGATACYLAAALCGVALVGLLACAFTGLCVAMLWPGSLVVAERRFPEGGVFIFAMMAAGGDLGIAVVPQLVGVVTDLTIASPTAAALAQSVSMSPEQLGLRLGLLVGALFPLAAVFVYHRLWKKYENQ